MNLQKKGRSSEGGPAASPMIKSAKYGEEEDESMRSWNFLPFHRARFIGPGSPIFS